MQKKGKKKVLVGGGAGPRKTVPKSKNLRAASGVLCDPYIREDEPGLQKQRDIAGFIMTGSQCSTDADYAGGVAPTGTVKRVAWVMPGIGKTKGGDGADPSYTFVDKRGVLSELYGFHMIFHNLTDDELTIIGNCPLALVTDSTKIAFRDFEAKKVVPPRGSVTVHVSFRSFAAYRSFLRQEMVVNTGKSNEYTLKAVTCFDFAVLRPKYLKNTPSDSTKTGDTEVCRVTCHFDYTVSCAFPSGLVLKDINSFAMSSLGNYTSLFTIAVDKAVTVDARVGGNDKLLGYSRNEDHTVRLVTGNPNVPRSNAAHIGDDEGLIVTPFGPIYGDKGRGSAATYHCVANVWKFDTKSQEWKLYDVSRGRFMTFSYAEWEDQLLWPVSTPIYNEKSLAIPDGKLFKYVQGVEDLDATAWDWFAAVVKILFLIVSNI